MSNTIRTPLETAGQEPVVVGKEKTEDELTAFCESGVSKELQEHAENLFLGAARLWIDTDPEAPDTVSLVFSVRSTIPPRMCR